MLPSPGELLDFKILIVAVEIFKNWKMSIEFLNQTFVGGYSITVTRAAVLPHWIKWEVVEMDQGE